jgi:hypothetical protein
MTVSGEMTKWQRFSIRLMEALTGLVCGGGLIGLFLLVSRLPSLNLWQQMDWGAQAAIMAGCLIVGALAFAYARWLDAATVVEFACDGRSFRFRRVGSGRIETRGLAEVEKVSRVSERGPLRYRVVFRDGAEAVLWCGDLPNAEVVAEWLGSHIQGG